MNKGGISQTVFNSDIPQFTLTQADELGRANAIDLNHFFKFVNGVVIPLAIMATVSRALAQSKIVGLDIGLILMEFVQSLSASLTIQSMPSLADELSDNVAHRRQSILV